MNPQQAVSEKLIRAFAGNANAPTLMTNSPGSLVDLVNGDQKTFGGWWTLRDNNSVFDSGFFISSQGVHLRGFGYLENSLRQVAASPKNKRRERIQGLMENGIFSHSKWLKTALEMDSDSDSSRRIWDCTNSPEHQSKIEKGLSALAKIILQRFNQGSGNAVEKPEEGGKQDIFFVHPQFQIEGTPSVEIRATSRNSRSD